MKINFDEVDYKEMYKVGNVIKDFDDILYLVVKDVNRGYALIDLTDNEVALISETLEGLRERAGDKDDVLVHAEINVL